METLVFFAKIRIEFADFHSKTIKFLNINKFVLQMNEER